jgi:ubiquinone/menaquinone biosynthesis C-methylase UbiE
MCNAYCVLFAALNLKKEEIRGRKILEVGASDDTGSVRPLMESYEPSKYIGADITKGPGVDVVCNAEKLMDFFPENSFDVLISTEMIEHVRNWKAVINNFKKIVVPEGTILITTRSFGFPYHAYPYDFWRYEVEDIKNIFSDCVIEKLEKDPKKGVFVKVRKLSNFVQNDLSDYALHSMVTNRRTKEVSRKELQDFMEREERNRRLRAISVNLMHVFGGAVFGFIDV